MFHRERNLGSPPLRFLGVEFYQTHPQLVHPHHATENRKRDFEHPAIRQPPRDDCVRVAAQIELPKPPCQIRPKTSPHEGEQHSEEGGHVGVDLLRLRGILARHPSQCPDVLHRACELARSNEAHDGRRPVVDEVATRDHVRQCRNVVANEEVIVGCGNEIVQEVHDEIRHRVFHYPVLKEGVRGVQHPFVREDIVARQDCHQCSMAQRDSAARGVKPRLPFVNLLEDEVVPIEVYHSEQTDRA